MDYYKTIACYSKKELISEAEKNMKRLDEKKISYKRGKNYQDLKRKLNIKNFKLNEMNGDTLFLLNVQLNKLLTINTQDNNE